MSMNQLSGRNIAVTSPMCPSSLEISFRGGCEMKAERIQNQLRDPFLKALVTLVLEAIRLPARE